MAEITFDATTFRAQNPAFADPNVYPTATLQAFFDAAACYISTEDYGYLSGDCRERALYLFTAHLVALDDTRKAGSEAQIITSSSVGGVSVSVLAPTATNEFQRWLSLTPYGLQLRALLRAKGVGGFVVGGFNATAGFRRPDGMFNG